MESCLPSACVWVWVNAFIIVVHRILILFVSYIHHGCPIDKKWRWLAWNLTQSMWRSTIDYAIAHNANWNWLQTKWYCDEMLWKSELRGYNIDNQTRMSIRFKSDRSDQRSCMASFSKMKWLQNMSHKIWMTNVQCANGYWWEVDGSEAASSNF